MKYIKKCENKYLTIFSYIALIILLIYCLVLINLKVNYSTEEIFNDNILKTVEIKTSDDESIWGYATGFFINNKGTILTNKHVVYNSTNKSNYKIIRVRLPNMENWIIAKIIKVSETEDLALIKIDKNNTKYFDIGEQIKNGEIVYTIGNPNGFGLSFSRGVVSSSARNVIYNNISAKVFQTSLIVNEGNSGGPVFNKEGKLLGIISFRLKDKNGEIIQGVSFAIPYNLIISFIESDE